MNTLPPETALRVWDVFFNEGANALFRVATALLKLNETKIVGCKDSGQVFSKFIGIGKDFLDCDKLIQAAFRDGIFSTSTAPSFSRHRGPFTAGPASMEGFGLAHLGPTTTTSDSIADETTNESNNENVRCNENVSTNNVPTNDIDDSGFCTDNSLADISMQSIHVEDMDATIRGGCCLTLDEPVSPSSWPPTSPMSPSSTRVESSWSHEKRGADSSSLHRDFHYDEIVHWRELFRVELEHRQREALHGLNQSRTTEEAEQEDPKDEVDVTVSVAVNCDESFHSDVP